jgi:uncharacterized protein YjbI with pentapeptide repeats
VSDRKQELLDQFSWLRHSAIITENLSDVRFAIPRGAAGWRVDGARFERVDFSGLDLEGFRVIGAEFVDCDFSRTKLKDNVDLGGIYLPPSGESDQRPTIYRRCSFDRADLVSRVNAHVLGAARFEHCSFAGTRLRGLRATRTEFVGCRFAGRVYACTFFGRPPDHDTDYPNHPLRRPSNAFADNDFRNADLVDCHFREGIDLTAQHWPSDPDYLLVTDVQAALDRVNGTIAALDDADQQATARFAIELTFRQTDPRLQTTQLVRLSGLRTDGDAQLAQRLFDALQPPNR